MSASKRSVLYSISPSKPPPGHGLYLSAVLPGGNAAKSGLRRGDVLLRYGGQKLSRYEDFQAAADGDAVPVQVWRDGETLERTVPPGPMKFASEPSTYC